MKTQMLTLLAFLSFHFICFGQTSPSGPTLPFSEKKGGGLLYQGYTLFYGDIDKDGSNDVICFGDANVFIHYTTTNPETTKNRRTNPVSVATGAYQGYSRSIEDMDDDGKFDLVFSGATKIFYYRGLGNRLFDSQRTEIVK